MIAFRGMHLEIPPGFVPEYSIERARYKETLLKCFFIWK